MATGLNATQLASLIKATTVGGKGFPLADQPPAVALGLYYSHLNDGLKKGQFGIGIDASQSAILLLHAVLDAQTNGHDYFTASANVLPPYQIYLPEATAALATTPAGPDNSGSAQFNPVETSPGEDALNNSSLGGLISNANTLLTDVVDPLFYRQVFFVVGGLVLVGIALFQLVNRGVIRPVGEGLRRVDNLAYDVANIRDNVGTPFAQYLRRRRNQKRRRTTGPGTKGTTGRPSPLQGEYDPNAKPPPRPRANKGEKPPPAKFTT